MDNNSTTIVFYKDYMDYYEIYSPFPHQDPKQVEDKIKREMMKKAGYSDDEIDMYSDLFDLQYDGADGFEDNPYTAVSLVKIIDRESPGAGPKSPPPEEEIKEPPQDPRQTMLQQYYGDRKAEANRRKKFARFKSHIIQKPIKTYDKDGNSKTIEVYTIEDYPEKEADTDELLLYGYATRLERLSRAHQGDFSPYEAEYYRRLDDVKTEIYSNYYEKVEKSRSEAEKFKKEHLKELENLSSEESIKKGIQVLIEKDTEFIETNNYGYNSHQNTQENLHTLGKYGEKSVKAPISVDQSVATKALLHSMNALIEIRNHTIAPIHQAVGTFVASPIHRLLTGTKRVTSEPVNVNGYYITPMKDMIATSQRNSVGMFKNKITHRYQARKDYFTQKISREEQERLMSTEKGYNINSVKRTSPRTLLKLAVLPRLMAVFNYKQGNAAVLNAGLYDIELATERRNKELSWKRDELLSLRGKIIRSKRILEDLEKIQSINKDNDPKKIEEIQKAIDYKRTQIAVYTGKFMERSRVEVDSIQTDALSMSQHDKANKSDIDKTVQVAKTAGRIAIARAISKYLYKTIAHQVKTPDKEKYIPGKKEYVDKTVEETVLVPGTKTEPGLDKESVGNITLDEIYTQGSGKLYYSVYDGPKGNTLEDNSQFFRGIEFTYEGQSISGSDGHGFDATALTTVQLSENINGNSCLVDVVHDVIQKATGKSFTKEEIEQMIIDEKISDIDIWRSDSTNGIPLGWLRASEIVPKIINEGTHEIPCEVPTKVERVVREVITTPGHWELIPGNETTNYTKEINAVIVAALAGLSATEINDWNDLLRYTRSKESIEVREPQHLNEMKSENNEKRESAKDNNKKSEEQKDNTKSQNNERIKRQIKSFQKNNKQKVRFYGNINSWMRDRTKKLAEERENVTAFERFMGTKKEDFRSGYDENAIEANNTDTSKEIKLEEEDAYGK